MREDEAVRDEEIKQLQKDKAANKSDENVNSSNKPHKKKPMIEELN